MHLLVIYINTANEGSVKCEGGDNGKDEDKAHRKIAHLREFRAGAIEQSVCESRNGLCREETP